MLVLSRKPGEKIFLEDGATKIEIQVVRIGPNTVRLGIAAPRTFNIVREELANGQCNKNWTVDIEVPAGSTDIKTDGEHSIRPVDSGHPG